MGSLLDTREEAFDELMSMQQFNLMREFLASIIPHSFFDVAFGRDYYGGTYQWSGTFGANVIYNDGTREKFVGKPSQCFAAARDIDGLLFSFFDIMLNEHTKFWEITPRSKHPIYLMISDWELGRSQEIAECYRTHKLPWYVMFAPNTKVFIRYNSSIVEGCIHEDGRFKLVQFDELEKL